MYNISNNDSKIRILTNSFKKYLNDHSLPQSMNTGETAENAQNRNVCPDAAYILGRAGTQVNKIS